MGARLLWRLSHPAPWSLLVAAVLSTPLFVAPGSDGPWGRPWYEERLLGVWLLLSTLLVLLGRTKDARLAGRRTALYPVYVALVAYGVFVANYSTVSSGDNLPTRSIPRALLRGDGLDLSDVVPRHLHSHYSVVRTDEGLASAFPLGTGLLATPYYWLAEQADPTSADPLGRSEARLEKHAASLLAALAVLFLYLASRHLFPRPETRLAATLLVVVGSPILLSVSQGLWSHTGEFFCLSLAAWAISKAPRPGPSAVAGLAAGLAFLCRPTAILVAPALVGFAPSVRPRDLRAFLISIAGTVGLLCAVNELAFGHPLGSYGLLNTGSRAWDAEGFLVRLAGILVSPSRGLLWFFPALVVALAILAVRIPESNREVRWKALAAGVPVVAIPLLTASFRNWWGGYSVGPRLLAELVVPGLILVALAWGQRTLRSVVAAALVAQLVLHVALFSSESAREWNGIVDVDRNPRILFSLSESQLAAAFVPGWTHVPPEPRYFRDPRPADSARRPTTPVDLSGQMNSDVGAWQGDPLIPPEARLYLPRLNAESVARALDFGFRLAAPGGPNAIRLCDGESTSVSLEGLHRFRRLAGIFVWRGAQHPPDPMVAILEVDRSHGREEVRGLRLGREVFDPATELAPPGHSILAGRWSDYDELVQTDFTLGKRASYERLRIRRPPDAAPGCLYVLALSVR